MIKAESVSCRYGKTEVLHPVSVRLLPGELTVVIGPNGAGKTRLASILSGDQAPSSGRVLVDGTDLSVLRPGELAQRRAVLPQASRLAFPFTVLEVVRLGILSNRLDAVAGNRLAVAMLERVDLSGFAGRSYQQFVGRRKTAGAGRPRFEPGRNIFVCAVAQGPVSRRAGFQSRYPAPDRHYGNCPRPHRPGHDGPGDPA